MKNKWLTLIMAFMLLAVTFGAAVSPVKAQEPEYISYVVKKGDTLGKISHDYCTTWQDIYNLNRDTIGKNPNVIQVGMVLTIPAYCSEATQLPGEVPPAGTVRDKGPTARANGYYNPPYYTVAWGDNLYTIGNRFGLDWTEIARANNIKGTLIMANQVLLIPGGTGGAVQLPGGQAQGRIERVNFQPGAISASLTGVINQGSPKSYILWAQKGQTITVETVSHGEPLVISIGNTGVDLLPLTGINSQIKNSVSAVLPASGDYVVTVRPLTGPENPQLAFDITFEID